MQQPRMRGALHAAVFPLAVVAGGLMVALAPTRPAKASAAVYALTSILLFGVSAAHHRAHCSPRIRDFLLRCDHTNIYLIIAGTYTPFAVLALHGNVRLAVLAAIWGGAAAGVAFRVVWLGAPRWLYISLYMGLGWIALFVLPQLLRGAGVAPFALVLAGGVVYSVGGVVYALRRPDPFPRWFGFHEVFHALTVVAYVTQYVAVSLIVYHSAG